MAVNAANFGRALEHVLVHEGGWADHPADPGGATMKGVTLATYRQYRPGATKADLRAISDSDLRMIYRAGYWNVIRGDDLPSGLDLAVFDFAVNSGPSRAARYLQKIVGVAQDGIIGPVTLAAVKRHDTRSLINRLCDDRMAFLRGLNTFATFGRGWTRRVTEVRATALSWVSASAEPAPPDPDLTPGTNWPAIIAFLSALAIAGVFLSTVL